MNQRILESSVPNSISAEPSRGAHDLAFITDSSLTKRKLSEKDLPSTSAKRSNSEGAHVSVNIVLGIFCAVYPCNLKISSFFDKLFFNCLYFYASL